VRRGLLPTREQARSEIAAGSVTVGGAPAQRPSRLVAPDEPIVLVAAPRFVSRGGLKLEAALEAFELSVVGARALDVGASTGGFTDCLLQRGAAHVVALDVGHGQLHERLRADGRVTVRERCNVRRTTPADLGDERFPLIVADLSFISLTTVAPALTDLAGEGADVVALIKPQFEAGRAEASRGRGVIRDPAIWRRAVERVRDAFEAGGAAMIGLMASPLTGADGNVEFLAHLRVSSRGEA
jgi:23S rRNA (cytidine1920-2'-O)/16S rRNA (cytidine1409-2'-O)-methyltransferase